MLGEIHCHTSFSSPRWFHRRLPSPFDLVDRAVFLGLDFLAITDHNSQSAFSVVERYALHHGLVLVPAVEVSARFSRFPFKQAHILAYGVTEIIQPYMSIDDTLSCIHSQAGLAVAAHPFCVKYGKFLYLGDAVAQFPFDGIEVFNSHESFVSNVRALDLAESLHLLQFAGSDAHCLSSLGNSCIRLFGDKTFDWREVVSRMRRGEFCIASARFRHTDCSFQRLRSSSLSFFYRCLRGYAA